MNNDGFTALTKCFFCNGDNAVLLNSKALLSNKPDRFIQEAHGKVVDMTPCSKCADYMKQGIILITIDPAKSDPGWERQPMPNPYRTGGWFVITAEGFKRVFQDCDNDKATEFGLKHRWMFIGHDAAQKLGLFDTPATA